MPLQEEGRVDTPQQSQTDGKANDSDKDPVALQPEYELDIVVVPAVAQVVGEEAPWVVVVLIREQDPHAIHILRFRIVVVSPDQAQEKRAG